MLDASTVQALLEPTGQAAVAEAIAQQPTARDFLVCYQRLAKRYPSTLAKAAVETALLRGRAREKFPRWWSLLYTCREALEQASREAVALYRASRYQQYPLVVDGTCGMGADTLALALTGRCVHALDTDPLRVALTSANAAVFHLADRIHVRLQDCTDWPLAADQAVWVDPSRRSGQKRWLNPHKCQPPLAELMARLGPMRPWGIKLAPGVPLEALQDYSDQAEVEFIAADGQLRECVLWFGPLRRSERRASVVFPSTSTVAMATANNTLEVLPLSLTYQPLTVSLSWSGPLPPPQMGPVAAYVYQPSPAVVRAGLLDLLSQQLAMSRLHHLTTLLTSDQRLDHPLVETYRVLEQLPADRKHLRRVLPSYQPRQVTIIQCGSPIDAHAWQKIAQRALQRCDTAKHDREQALFLLLTHDCQHPCILLAERVSGSV
jgi:hypothetical protein